jgi:hypothetical protein
VFVPALASIDDLVPHDGVLTLEELEQLARQIAVRPELWEPLVRIDPAGRRYELLYEDDRLDLYSPRLDWVGQYRLDDEREIHPGRRELTAQPIALGALRALERF